MPRDLKELLKKLALSPYREGQGWRGNPQLVPQSPTFGGEI